MLHFAFIYLWNHSKAHWGLCLGREEKETNWIVWILVHGINNNYLLHMQIHLTFCPFVYVSVFGCKILEIERLFFFWNAFFLQTWTTFSNKEENKNFWKLERHLITAKNAYNGAEIFLFVFNVIYTCLHCCKWILISFIFVLELHNTLNRSCHRSFNGWNFTGPKTARMQYLFFLLYLKCHEFTLSMHLISWITWFTVPDLQIWCKF